MGNNIRILLILILVLYSAAVSAQESIEDEIDDLFDEPVQSINTDDSPLLFDGTVKDWSTGVLLRTGPIGTVIGFEYLNKQHSWNWGIEVYMGWTRLGSSMPDLEPGIKFRDEGTLLGLRLTVYSPLMIYTFLDYDMASNITIDDNGSDILVDFNSANPFFGYAANLGCGYEFRGKGELENLAVAIEFSISNGVYADTWIFKDAGKFGRISFFYGIGIHFRF